MRIELGTRDLDCTWVVLSRAIFRLLLWLQLLFGHPVDPGHNVVRG